MNSQVFVRHEIMREFIIVYISQQDLHDEDDEKNIKKQNLW